MNKQRVFSFFVSWLEGCPHGGISLQSFRCQKCCARSCKVVPLPPNNVSWLICSFQGKGYGVHYDDSTIVIHFSELLQLLVAQMSDIHSKQVLEKKSESIYYGILPSWIAFILLFSLPLSPDCQGECPSSHPKVCQSPPATHHRHLLECRPK